MLTIYPYRYDFLGSECGWDSNVWVFDDEANGLKEEGFVLGMSEMIQRLVDQLEIPDAEKGFALSFSDQPFDGHHVELEWFDNEEYQGYKGNWYQGEVMGEQMKGWLCPALFHYFSEAPAHIYVKADPLPEGVNPLWDTKEGHQYFGGEDG